MTHVLVLGNGISRLQFHDQIEAWEGEVWGCNYVYKDYAHKLTRLTGEVHKMWEGMKYRNDNGYTYELWGGNLGKPPDCSKLWTCPKKFWNDSGTSAVAQALHEGCHVEAAGFDLGGADVYYHAHYRKNKRRWVERWAALVREYGASRITFWGYDHIPYIQRVINGKADPAEYQRIHKTGRPHIPTDKYAEILKAQHVKHHTGPGPEIEASPFVRGVIAKRRVQNITAKRYEGIQIQKEKPMNEQLIDVRYKNGFRAKLRRAVAERMESKGELAIIKIEKPKPAKRAVPEVTPEVTPEVEQGPDPKDDLVQTAVELKIGSPSTLRRWSTERLTQEIERAQAE